MIENYNILDNEEQGAIEPLQETAIKLMPPAEIPARDEASAAMRDSATHGLPALETLTALVKTRQQWQKTRNRNYLHALSLCRSACDGDKTAAVKLYKATQAGDDLRLVFLIEPMIEEIERWDTRIAALEKPLLAAFEQMPIAAFVKATKGLGPLSMATIVGMTGAFDQYSSECKLWSRLGLGVSVDGRSRQPLIVPGISDVRPRRAAAYVIGAGMLKAGNETFRALYDREKAKALAKHCEENPWPKLRAHNHAMRYGTKYFIRSMWREWRKHTMQETA
jgi:hypothetical protein